MEKIQEITECCICTDIFTEPRILPCIHTFCLKCLDETALKRDLKPGDAMPCPLCREPFAIPKEGMAGLSKNFFVQRLVEILEASAQPSNKTLCEICMSGNEGDKEVQSASQYCIQCHQNICDRCCRDHTRFKDLQNHQLIEIGCPLKDELIRKASLQYCTLHGKEEVKLFCVDCKDVICMMCFAQKHKSHNCSDIEKVAEKLCRQIKRDIESMSGFAEKTIIRIQQSDDIQREFQEKVEDIEKEIIQRGTELKELVDKCTRSLLDELALTRQRVSKENKSTREELETHKMIIKSFETYCTELSSKGSSAEICRAANDVHLRAKELRKVHQKCLLQKISTNKVEFEKSDVEELLKNGNIIGNIREIRETEKTDKQERTVTVRGGKLLNESEISTVCGVARLENKIFVIFEKGGKSKSIRIYEDQEPFNFKKEIDLKNEIEGAICLTCSEKSKCLYITNSIGGCIWRMTTKNHRLTKWITGLAGELIDLSKTPEDHLLVLRKRLLHCNNELEIYGSDAKLIRCVPLPSDVLTPYAVIQQSNGEFIIIHRLNDAESGPWVISRLTSDGQTVLCRTDPNDKLQKLKRPSGLALDSENDLLFVSDFEKHRVTLFDSTSLKFAQNLVTKENEIYFPQLLLYSEEIKQLIIPCMAGYVLVCLF